MKKQFLILFLLLAGLMSAYAQNNALDFDGTDDYVDCGIAQTALGSNFTIEAWVYPETAGNYRGVGGAHGATPQGIIFLQYQSGTWKCAIYDGSAYQAVDVNLPLSQWSHVAMVHDGGSKNIKVYLNGVLYGENTYTGTFVPYSYFWIGRAYEGADRYFDGKIDEFRIWNVVRTETEIRQNIYRELPDPSTETNLIAYYKLNETSGTTANDSKDSYDGTLTNYGSQTAYWQTSPAMFGPKNALDFDGSNDYVDISSLHINGSAFTIETWVYFDSFNGSADANITNVFRGGDENIALRIGDGGMDNNMPQFVVTIGGSQYKLNANTRLSPSVWYHIAAVYDGANMSLYINGKLDKSQSQSGSLTTTNSSLILGGSSDGSRMLEGLMEEVRVWSDARTASEIRNNMCKNLTGNESGLTAYYSFDNSSGTTLPDYTGNNHDGTLNNMDNSDWVSSSAYNTWLNTSSSAWSTTTNWSMGSKPISDNIGIYSYTGGTVPTFTNADEAAGGHVVVDLASEWAISGSFGVSGNLILESDIDLNGQTIFLWESAYLIEDAGRVYGTTGQIQTTRNLSNISSENVAGLGAEITTSANMGSTTILRTHAADSDPVSIKRRYNITPTTNTGLNATLAFHYNDEELNGLTESSIRLLRSTDGGATWDNFGGFVNTSDNTITRSSIDAFSSWTAGVPESPIIETSNPSQNYFSGTTSVVIAPAVSVTYDGDITAATVSVSPVDEGDLLSVDVLDANWPAGLTAEWNNASKILTISGASSSSNYQTALRLVKFESTSTTSSTRTIDFNLGDGIGLTIYGQKHFYEVIGDGVSNISWTDARAAALNSIYAGSSGYLATITSATENTYLKEKVTEDTWIGASDAAVEGVWKWMDGPEAGIQFWQGNQNGSSVGDNYNNWLPGEEPNNWSSQEHYAHMRGPDLPAQWGYWNDYSNTTGVKYYITEYGGDGTVFTTMDDATVVVKTDLTWDGSESSVWTIAGNWSQDVAPNASLNISISDQANDPIIGIDVDASCNNLTVEAGGSLTIQSASGGTGSLIIKGTLANSGTITAQRCFPGAALQNWHMISSPMMSMDISESGFAPGGSDDFYAWHEPDPGTWVNYKTIDPQQNPTFSTVNGSDNFVPGKGYLVAYNEANPTKTFTGTLNTGDKSFLLKNSTSKGWTYHTGWNLLGNPYSSAIDWTTVDHSEASLFQDVMAYAYNPQAGGGVGDFVAIDGSSETPAYIAANQGFFVLAKTDNTTFSFTPAMQSHGGTYYKKGDVEQKLVLRFTGETYYDETTIRLRTESSFNRDRVDAIKMYSYNADAPNVYSLSNDNIKLMVNSIPDIDTESNIKLGFAAPKDGLFTISVVEAPDYMMDNIIYLEDLQLGSFHKISESEYNFTSDKGDFADRFVIHFGIVGIEEGAVEGGLLQVWNFQNTLYIINNQHLSGEVTIVNIIGQQVAQYQLSGETKQVIPVKVKSGFYIVNIKYTGGNESMKVIIK